jgi:hypothetical protein
MDDPKVDEELKEAMCLNSRLSNVEFTVNFIDLGFLKDFEKIYQHSCHLSK